jgi:hypothetical protein
MLNKILKYFFSSTNVILIYLLKKLKLIKWSKKKSIKYSNVKKITLNLLRKNKTFISSLEIRFKIYIIIIIIIKPYL